MPENVLLAWLCIWRYQLGGRNDGIMQIPERIWRRWESHGWIELDGTPDECGYLTATITDLGNQVVDLNSPDWGIDTIPEAA